MDLKKLLKEIEKESFEIEDYSVLMDGNDEVVSLSEIKRIFKKYK